MAKIRAVNKLPMAQSAKKAAIKDGQAMANIVIWAEIKFGEMLAAIKPEYKTVGSRQGTNYKGTAVEKKKTLPTFFDFEFLIFI